MRVKFRFKLGRDGNYYFGLVMLVVASVSILWAFFFDGFEPVDFLVYFLIYAWGFTLLLKSDTEYRLNRLETTVTILKDRLDAFEIGDLPAVEALEALEVLEATEETEGPDAELREENDNTAAAATLPKESEPSKTVTNESKPTGMTTAMDQSDEIERKEGGCFTDNDQ